MNADKTFAVFDLATDPGFMAPQFAAVWDDLFSEKGRLISVDIPRLSFVEDKRIAIQYELSVEFKEGNRTEVRLIGGLLSLERSSAGDRCSNPDNGFFLRDLPICLTVFPSDPALPGLGMINNMSRLEELTESLAARGIAFDSRNGVRFKPLSWRLGKRAVMLAEVTNKGSRSIADPPSGIVLKYVRPSKFSKIKNALETAADLIATTDEANRFSIPALLNSDRQNGLFVFERIEGMTIYQMLDTKRVSSTPDLMKAVEEAGALLRKLHGLDGSDLAAHTYFDELRSTRQIVDRVTQLFPESSATFDRHLSELPEISEMVLTPDQTGVVHRDFYDKQVLCGAGAPGLLDIDNLAAGDPAQDIGNFLAHLRLRGVQFAQARSFIERGGRLFLEGYGIMEDSLLKRIPVWNKLSLIRLTALYLLRPRWRSIALRLLDDQVNEQWIVTQTRGRV